MEGKRIGGLRCTVSMFNVFLYLLGWIFLSAITLGLAIPFFAFWFIKYFINHTEFIIEEQ